MTSTTLPEGVGRAFVTTLRETLLGAADALGDLDRRAGDGDFGTNVRTAMKLVAARLDTEEPTSYRGWLTALYMGWLGVGGTSGPLFGMFFRDIAKAAEADGGEGADENAVPSLAQFAEAIAAGQATVQKYGEAEVGDKTMIDALAPAVAALREAVGAGAAAGEALAAAEQAAVEAARATAETTARRGRASYVGDVAKGVIDPGAAAMALVIGAARAAVDGDDVDTAWIG
ncbi:MAG TPA: DAK2 domain-containing protein [Brachybacterium faecium]|nr:DAK2 domain-containing protein [Brachybacterium faecium]